MDDLATQLHQNATARGLEGPKVEQQGARNVTSLGLWLFIAFASLYILSTHGHVQGMGYEDEAYLTTKQMIEHGDASLYGSGSNGQPKAYSRNDLTQPLLLVPFYLASKLVPTGGAFGEEWVIALFNPLVSAAIVVLVYRFVVGLFDSQKSALLIAALCGLGTMIWPYSAIGMEPLQTLLVLAAAYFAFTFRRQGATWQMVAAAIALALLFQAKRASAVMVPALLLYVAFVAWERYRTARLASLAGTLILFVLLAFSIATSIWLGTIKNTGLVEGFPGPHSGALTHLLSILREGNFVVGALYGFLFSAGKSYFLYNPPVLLGLLAFPAFVRTRRAEGLLFCGLLVSPYVFYSTLWWWSDETWGPRYLHVTVPFALIFLGALGWQRLQSNRWQIAAWLSLAGGIAVQLLGLLFWYGRYLSVLTAAKLNTIQNIQYEPQLSNLWINLLLLRSNLSTRVLGRPVYLDYTPRYWFTPPPGYEQMAQPRHVDLQPFHDIALWFPVTLFSTNVSVSDKLASGLLAVLLVALLALAIAQIARAFKADDVVPEPATS